jgi:hypothetical protein
MNNTVLVKGGYLMRSVSMSGSTLALVGDLNATVSLEIVAPPGMQKVTFNGQNLSVKKSTYNTLLVTKSVSLPAVTLPELNSITWVRSACQSVGRHCLTSITEIGELAS